MSARRGLRAHVSPPAGFRQLPGFVATCHWEGCGAPTKLGLTNVTLSVPVHDPPWFLKRVPLCAVHLARFHLTKQLRLAYHPEEAMERDSGE